uniref:SFRICE_037957 n=1 Tax=Spodoptera frugiperda TaxID=7108 RepID=A0A2H1VSP0_SPOFR
MDAETISKRKRPAGSPPISRNNPPKFAKSTNSRQCYTARDNPPYIVHVSLIESQTPGTTLHPVAKSEIPVSTSTQDLTLFTYGCLVHPVKFGMLLMKSNINNVKIGGVKRLERNRVSVEFESHEDANSFLGNCAFLQNYNLSIPLFNISRMGIVRNVPVEWTEDEIIDNVRVPTGCGIVIKARRMN